MNPGWMKTSLLILLLVAPMTAALLLAATPPHEPRAELLPVEDEGVIVRETDALTDPGGPQETSTLIALDLPLEHRPYKLVRYRLLTAPGAGRLKTLRRLSPTSATTNADPAAAHFLPGEALARSDMSGAVVRCFVVPLVQVQTEIPEVQGPEVPYPWEGTGEIDDALTRRLVKSGLLISVCDLRTHGSRSQERS